MTLRRRDTDGFSVIEVMVGLLILSILSVVVLVTIQTAAQVTTRAQSEDGAISLAYQVLQQAEALGCGSVTGTEPPNAAGPGTQPSALGNVWSRCVWSGWIDGVTPNYTTTPPVAPCPIGTPVVVSYLSDTPWICMVSQNLTYAVQLSSTWTYPNIPAHIPSQNYCNAIAPSLSPLDILRSVKIQWFVNGKPHIKTYSRLDPVPAGSLATHLGGSGGLCFYSTASPGTTANGLALQITEPGAADPTNPGNTWYIQKAGNADGNENGCAPCTAGAVWFPFLSPGTWKVAKFSGGTYSLVTTVTIVSGQTQSLVAP